MKNYIQPGNTVTVAAPTGGVSSGDGVLVGSLFGVANTDAVEAADVEISTVGVFTLPKAGSQSWTAGAKAYWDNAAGNVTTTATGNTLIGCALAAAASADTTGTVRLNGTV